MLRVPLKRPDIIYDLGCGNGNVTRVIAKKWSKAAVIGVDSSEEMLSSARSTPSRVQWRWGNLMNWQPDHKPSLLFCNAVIQWLPDHQEFIPRIWSMLSSGGCLAVQAPMSWDLPSHKVIRDALKDSSIGDVNVRLRGYELKSNEDLGWLHNPDFYFDLLSSQSVHIDMWSTEYVHILEGDNAVLEWVKGTSLRPILAALNKKEQNIYLEIVRQRLNQIYQRRSDGTTLYRFRRLFFVAVHR